MNVSELVEKWWELGAVAVAGFVGFRKKRIEGIVREVINPDVLMEKLENIEQSVSGAHEKLDQLAIEVYTLKGRTEAAADEPHTVKPSAFPRLPVR